MPELLHHFISGQLDFLSRPRCITAASVSVSGTSVVVHAFEWGLPYMSILVYTMVRIEEASCVSIYCTF